MSSIFEYCNRLDKVGRLLTVACGQSSQDDQAALVHCVNVVALAGLGARAFSELARVAREYASEAEGELEEQLWFMFLRGFTLARFMARDGGTEEIETSWAA